MPFESPVAGTIFSAIEGPYGSVEPGALQLDSVVMPSACREDTGPFQTKAARGQGELAVVLPLGIQICFLDRDGQALKACDCVGARD